MGLFLLYLVIWLWIIKVIFFGAIFWGGGLLFLKFIYLCDWSSGVSGATLSIHYCLSVLGGPLVLCWHHLTNWPTLLLRSCFDVWCSLWYLTIPKMQGSLLLHPTWILIPGCLRGKWRATSHTGNESRVGTRWEGFLSHLLGHIKGKSHSAEVHRAEQSRCVSCHLSVVSFGCLVWHLFCLRPSRGLPEMLGVVVSISLFLDQALIPSNLWFRSSGRLWNCISLHKHLLLTAVHRNDPLWQIRTCMNVNIGWGFWP